MMNTVMAQPDPVRRIRLWLAIFIIGLIVSGITANKATEAALAAYPGGVVDRVVQLSNGEYEVHNIGVNWPHHIFENIDFQVIGADD